MTRAHFLQAAAASTSAACILWPYAVRKSSGYGAHSTRDAGNQTHYDAHAYSCTLAHGPRPTPEHEAAHSCGDKLCVSGAHLRWATHQENMDDAKAHGTLRGGGRGRQKLFKAERTHIATSGKSLLQLADEYGMEPAYLGQVRRAVLLEAA